MGHNAAAIWHTVALSRDINAISAVLHDDCIFESPVVHTPQLGRPSPPNIWQQLAILWAMPISNMSVNGTRRIPASLNSSQ